MVRVGPGVRLLKCEAQRMVRGRVDTEARGARVVSGLAGRGEDGTGTRRGIERRTGGKGRRCVRSAGTVSGLGGGGEDWGRGLLGGAARGHLIA